MTERWGGRSTRLMQQAVEAIRSGEPNVIVVIALENHAVVLRDCGRRVGGTEAELGRVVFIPFTEHGLRMLLGRPEGMVLWDNAIEWAKDFVERAALITRRASEP